jgi:hypothetical protein
MHAGASEQRFALQKCIPERRTLFRIVKMHAVAQEAVSHYKNAGRRVRNRFALQKCMPQLTALKSIHFIQRKGSAHWGVSHYKNAGRSLGLAKMLVLPMEVNRQAMFLVSFF